MNRVQSLLLFVSLCVVASVSDAGSVPSGPRRALLIGNAAYEGFELKGVGKSLDTVEQSLKKSGFQVDRRENLNEKEFKAVTESFAITVPSNSVAAFYYIGLGASVDRLGKTYNMLRPVRETIESDNDYRSRGLNIADFLKTLQEKSGSRTRLLFLDACFDSPIVPENGAVKSGLTEMEVAPQTTVVFASESKKPVEIPSADSPSRLAIALARNLPQLDESITETCKAISQELGDCWVGNSSSSGIGPPSPFPFVEFPTDGRSPGDGFVNSIGMSFRWCPPGKFVMGSDETSSAATRDRSAVDVELTKGFWMGEYEVTQREYSIVARRNVPNGFTTDPAAPFWGTSDPKGVSDFCKKLNDLERKAGTLPSGWEYVCPTEAEWEYACRAGSKSAFCFGDSADELGQFSNFADRTLGTSNPNYYWALLSTDDGIGEALAPVGSYFPNAWGLRDMHGNVAEVVADHLVADRPGGKDPLVKVEKNGQIQIRGGAWCSRAEYCESSFRNSISGRDKQNYVGFRIVLKKVK